jgi:hypothetical protein
MNFNYMQNDFNKSTLKQIYNYTIFHEPALENNSDPPTYACQEIVYLT